MSEAGDIQVVRSYSDEAFALAKLCVSQKGIPIPQRTQKGVQVPMQTQLVEDTKELLSLAFKRSENATLDAYKRIIEETLQKKL